MINLSEPAAETVISGAAGDPKAKCERVIASRGGLFRARSAAWRQDARPDTQQNRTATRQLIRVAERVADFASVRRLGVLETGAHGRAVRDG